MTTKIETGRLGEELAVNALTVHGYEIYERNWCSVDGEIDIIAMDGDTLVFVEVKTRVGTRMGNPADAVDEAKVYRLQETALAYIQWEDLEPMPNWRIDIMGILLTKEHKVRRINLYKNAITFDQ